MIIAMLSLKANPNFLKNALPEKKVSNTIFLLKDSSIRSRELLAFYTIVKRKLPFSSGRTVLKRGRSQKVAKIKEV